MKVYIVEEQGGKVPAKAYLSKEKATEELIRLLKEDAERTGIKPGEIPYPYPPNPVPRNYILNGLEVIE